MGPGSYGQQEVSYANNYILVIYPFIVRLLMDNNIYNIYIYYYQP